MRGYRVDDIPPPAFGGVKPEVAFTRPKTLRSEVINNPTLVSRNLPFCIGGACYVKPDHKDPLMIALGALKRMGSLKRDVPEEDRRVYRDFCVKTFTKMFDPLELDQFKEPEQWLADLDISEERRAELRAAMEENNFEGIHFDDPAFIPLWASVEAFIKDEFYFEPKMTRWINARNDRVKAWFGPLVDMAMKVFAACPNVIKTVPVSDRARYIHDWFYAEGRKYGATDFTSFEAHFKDWLMEIEGLFIEYLLQRHPLVRLLKVFYEKVLSGQNVSKMRNFGAFIFWALRCSGEMNTSFGNTFHNLMTILFCLEENGAIDSGTMVEGDDSIFFCEPPECMPRYEQFERFGWEVKMEQFSNLGDASFCGNVYDPDDMIVVTDPRKVMLTLGWTSRKYLGARPAFLSGLLRSKVLSMAHQYGRNPIIWKLSSKLLQLTENCKIRKSIVFGMDAYHRENFRRFLDNEPIISEPPIGTRLLVERLYGISLDLQYQIEDDIDDITELGTWFPRTDILTDKQHEQWERYVSNLKWSFREDDIPPAWKDQLSKLTKENSSFAVWLYRYLDVSGTSDRC